MIKHIAKPIWLLTLLIAILLPRLTYAQALPPIPYEESGVCPFECCNYGEWTVNEKTTLYKYRSHDSPVMFTVKPKEKVQSLTGVVVTLIPDEVSIDRPTMIHFYAPNSDNYQDIQAQPGDILYLLTSRGEGNFRAWFKDQFREVDASLLLTESNQRNIRRGKRTWWVKIKNSQGQIGWTDQSNHFANQHQC